MALSLEDRVRGLNQWGAQKDKQIEQLRLVTLELLERVKKLEEAK